MTPIKFINMAKTAFDVHHGRNLMFWSDGNQLYKVSTNGRGIEVIQNNGKYNLNNNRMQCRTLNIIQILLRYSKVSNFKFSK